MSHNDGISQKKISTGFPWVDGWSTRPPGIRASQIIFYFIKTM